MLRLDRLLAMALAVNLSVTVAVAQENKTATAVAESAAGQGGIADIVVTANRRSESIQKVPIAITAVTAERLAAANIMGTESLARVVSGLTFQISAGGTAPHLRGIGTTAVGAGVENSVATYVDGVYILSVNGALVQLNNIEQVEVLKGPQGTLFGRNATGGVVNIRTKDPKQELSGEFTARYGNYQTASLQGYLTGGLAPNVAADIAGFVSLQGKGYGQNLFLGKDVNKLDQYAIRSKALIEPTDRDQIRIIGDFSRMKGPGIGAYGLIKGTAVNYGPGTTLAGERPDLAEFVASGVLAPFAEVGEPFPATGGFQDTYTARQPYYSFNTGGASLQWDHEFDAVKVTSITAYRRAVQRVGFPSIPAPADRGYATIVAKDKQFSQEIQLSSNTASDVKWLAGLYYMNGTATYEPFVISGTSLSPLESLTFFTNQKTKSGAIFGQATIPLWEGAHLTGGLRYTTEQRKISGKTILTFLPAFGGSTLETGAVDAAKTFKKLTFRAALDQQVTPEVLVYASFNRGFKSGVFNAVPPSSVVVKPEVLDAYEAGFKADLFDRHLRLNVGGFYYDYSNLQVTVFQAASAVLQNGAAAKLYGVDIDATAQLGENLTINAGATLMDSKFTSYPDAGFFNRVPIADGGGVNQTIGSAKGNKIPYAPDVTFNIGAVYSVPIGDGALDATVNYSYSSRFYSGPDNILGQGRYGLLDSTLTYKFADEKMKVGVFGKNLTNKNYYTYLIAQANPGGFEEGQAAAPRTYGVMVGYSF
ncbi:TonB-dependent receptor [Sphingobium xenophagum]|nr:TonB-dependent receptor [Sphingobium xenophagum]